MICLRLFNPLRINLIKLTIIILLSKLAFGMEVEQQSCRDLEHLVDLMDFEAFDLCLQGLEGAQTFLVEGYDDPVAMLRNQIQIPIFEYIENKIQGLDQDFVNSADSLIDFRNRTIIHLKRFIMSKKDDDILPNLIKGVQFINYSDGDNIEELYFNDFKKDDSLFQFCVQNEAPIFGYVLISRKAEIFTDYIDSEGRNILSTVISHGQSQDYILETLKTMIPGGNFKAKLLALNHVSDDCHTAISLAKSKGLEGVCEYLIDFMKEFSAWDPVFHSLDAYLDRLTQLQVKPLSPL